MSSSYKRVLKDFLSPKKLSSIRRRALEELSRVIYLYNSFPSPSIYRRVLGGALKDLKS